MYLIATSVLHSLKKHILETEVWYFQDWENPKNRSLSFLINKKDERQLVEWLVGSQEDYMQTLD